MEINQEVLQTLTTREGTANRLRRIFAYHYDQIIRECEQELFGSISDQDPDFNDESSTVNDFIVGYMEEQMGWPDANDQNIFNKQIANIND